jgi:hypothetical protein
MTTYIIGSTLNIYLGLEDWLDPEGYDLKVKIELTRNNGISWETITDSTNNFSTYNLVISAPVCLNAYLKYSDPNDPSIYFYSNVFNITNTSVTDLTIFKGSINDPGFYSYSRNSLGVYSFIKNIDNQIPVSVLKYPEGINSENMF